MPGLVPGSHVLLAALLLRDGWPGQVFSPGHNRQILPPYKENPGAALGPDGIGAEIQIVSFRGALFARARKL